MPLVSGVLCVGRDAEVCKNLGHRVQILRVFRKTRQRCLFCSSGAQKKRGAAAPLKRWFLLDRPGQVIRTFVVKVDLLF